jgi:hypothetical protein
MILALIADDTERNLRVVQSLYSEQEPWMVGHDVRDVTDIDGIEPGWVAEADGSFSAPRPPAPAPVLSVSSVQAKIQLRRANLREKVDAAVQEAGGETMDWFTDARTWERNNPNVLAIGKALDLEPTDIDKLFSDAAQISA